MKNQTEQMMYYRESNLQKVRREHVSKSLQLTEVSEGKKTMEERYVAEMKYNVWAKLCK